MSLTNSYCTLAEMRQWLQDRHTYTASTLSFTASSKTIADTARGLKRFQDGDFIKISGATNASNNGYFTVATGNAAGSLITTEALTDESAGASITISVYDDLTNDADLERAIEAASRWIEAYTGWRFYSTAADETRYYTAWCGEYIYVPDGLLSITTLATDDEADRTYSTTWAATDYDLWPYNAAIDTPPGPYLRIESSPLGSYSFPTGPRGVKIVGKFGYSTAANQPQQIREACLIRAAQLFKRKDAIFGVTGATAFGQALLRIPPDPDVEALLRPFIRSYL